MPDYLAAASESDIGLFKELNLELPEGSIICADKGYTDYHYEDLLEEIGLHLKAQRKKNSKRPMPAWEEFLSKPSSACRGQLGLGKRVTIGRRRYLISAAKYRPHRPHRP